MKLPAPPRTDAQAKDGSALDSLLQHAGALLASASAYAMTLEQIGIELPPLHAAQIDQARLRAVASLYLASELENAGLITAVETLAGLLRSAALDLDVGGASPMLLNFWKNRNQRATSAERQHSFANLFEGNGFEENMLALCEALYKLDENSSNPGYGSMTQQTRVRANASRLQEQLQNVSGGITVFLAQEILQSLREAISILKQHDLQAALGARDVWSAIHRINQLTRSRQKEARLYVQRGKAGMTVLSWLADAAPHLEQQGSALVKLDHPVIPAALDWMQAALAIGETQAPAAATQSPATSAWSALAA